MANTAADPSPLDPLNRMEPDEPRFVLRGKDAAAPCAITEWAARTRLLSYRRHMDDNGNPKTQSDREAHVANLTKCAEAEVLALEMESWRKGRESDAQPGIRAVYDETTRTADQIRALKNKQKTDQIRDHIQEARYHLKLALELAEQHGVVGLDPYYTEGALQHFGDFAGNLEVKGD